MIDRGPKRGHRSSLFITAAVMASALACSDDPVVIDTFDGNFIAGDAEPRDGGFPDAVADVGPDAAPADSGEPDAGQMDAASMDADICLSEAVRSVTATQARAEAAQLVGLVIDLTGTATRTGLDCTERACPPDNPCCNDCTARVLVDGIALEATSCFEPGCAGSECAQSCRPALLGLPQTYRGVLSTAAPDLQLLLYRSL